MPLIGGSQVSISPTQPPHTLLKNISVLVMIFCSCNKALWPYQPGEEMTYLTLQFVVRHLWQSGQELLRIWRQNLTQNPWKNTSHWFAPYSLNSLSYYIPQDHQLRGDTTHSNWACYTYHHPRKCTLASPTGQFGECSFTAEVLKASTVLLHPFMPLKLVLTEWFSPYQVWLLE